ncbi:MAG: DUF327 family protein [Brevinematales bacterium]|nr:DUF327 family protein [Brevinematales bacterium]
MRIEPLKSSEKGKAKGHTKVIESGGSFSSALQSSETDMGAVLDTGDGTGETGDIYKIAETVTKFGDELGRDPTPENFTRYKKQITRFVKLVRENFEIKDTTSRSGLRKIHLYKSIDIIDQNLAKLAEIILSHETNRLEALKLVESIKGLIVDLLL